MNVTELREVLEDLETEGLGDAEVNIATQPEYPLAFTIASVGAADSVEDVGYDEDAEYDELNGPPDKQVVWIASGDHPTNPYASRAAWNR